MSPIVCGIERSEDARAATHVAAALARRLGSRLELVHVSAPGAPPATHLVESAMHGIRDDLSDDDVSVRLVSGEPADRLVDAARDATLLVVGSRDAGALRQALFGSVTDSVCRASPTPVVVVPEAAEGIEGDAVVLGVRDPSDEPCARTAARLADALGMQLVLAHVHLPPVVAGYPAVMPDAAPLALAEDPGVEESGEQLLRELADALASELDRAPEVRVVNGPPGPELVRLADDAQAALLAVGSPHRGTLAAALAGASSRHVIRHGGRPVLVCPHRE